MKFLCITVRFLHSTAHGRTDGGAPEWPPSPLRLLQALVAAAAGRWNERQLLDYAVPALRWLESQGQTMIVAPNGVPSDVRTQFYVPDNTADLLVPAWKKGDVDKTPKRTEKVVRPTHLDGPAVHYLFSTSTDVENHIEVLRAAARSITHLGWGVDMAVGDARLITEEEAEDLTGHRWRPVPTGGTPLRVPRPGTLDDLIRKHRDFLTRMDQDGFHPVPPLNCFDVIGYSCPTLQPLEKRPLVAFQILDSEGERYKAFNTSRRCCDVAAWVRHATGTVCENWPYEDYASFVHGHDADGKQIKGTHADQRFHYLPVPTIESRPSGLVVGAIRRVMIIAPHGYQDRIDYLRRRLPGQELFWEEKCQGILNQIPKSDPVLRNYTGQSHTWSTVTPVIWPGYDDRDPRKAEKLLRKAFIDAGIPSELVNTIEELEWRQVGFRAGLDLARNYTRPPHFTGSMYHVFVRFAQPLSGPLVVGAGRYRGFGLFATHD